MGTNGKSCNTCHPNGKDIDGSKKTYSILGSKLDNIEDAVNFCIKMALAGEKLEKESAEMKDLVSYLKGIKGSKKKGLAPGY